MAAMVISPDHSRALLKCQPANSRPKPLGHGGLDHHGAGDVAQGRLGLALASPDDRVHGRLPSVSPLQLTSAAERASGRRLAGPYACRSGLAAAGAIRPL